MLDGRITTGVIERFAITFILCLAFAAAALYLSDWAVWRVRYAHGTSMGTVRVTRTVVAPLKGNKEEYYPAETSDVPCSRSIFPEGATYACWWLERHSQVIDR